MSKYIYIVMADIDELGLLWGEYLTKSTAVCPNYKTAYHVGLSISSMTEPRSSYRVSLEKLKENGAVKIEDGDGKYFTIVKTKFIKYF